MWRAFVYRTLIVAFAAVLFALVAILSACGGNDDKDDRDYQVVHPCALDVSKCV